MTPAARERAQVRTPVLLLTASAWLLLVLGSDHTALMTHCPAGMLGKMPWRAVFEHVQAQSEPGPLALGWAVMLAAMMGPMLIAPVRHVRDSSFARRRARASALFVLGYGAVWMAGGLLLMAMELALRIATPEPAIGIALVFAIALVWQASPTKQRCLNRCHAHPELAAFGTAADLDALRFGWKHGVWCAGSCWALMLAPLMVSRGHVTVMAGVTLWLSAERLDRPMPVGWRLRAPGKAMRIAVAQARMQCRLAVNGLLPRIQARSGV